MTGESANGQAIARVRYTHDAMVDLLIARPEVTQNEVAEYFGYSPPWVSRVIRSDAFRERLAARKTEIVDPAILERVEARFEGLVERSLEILMEKLQPKNNPTSELALKTADLGARAMGYGAKSGPSVNIQQNFVVAMPQKARTAEEWLEGREVLQTIAPT